MAHRIAVSCIGGSKIGSTEASDDIDNINSDNNLRHIGAILFAVQFALNVLVTFLTWGDVYLIMFLAKADCLLEHLTNSS